MLRVDRTKKKRPHPSGQRYRVLRVTLHRDHNYGILQSFLRA